MADHYDALETRDPDARERDLFARLSEIVARALTAPGWASHLAGVDPASVTSRATLAALSPIEPVAPRTMTRRRDMKKNSKFEIRNSKKV